MRKFDDKLFERIAAYSIQNKDKALQKHVLYMLDKLQSLIDIKGLPLTMPKRNIVNQLLINGFTFVTEHEENLFGFYGGLGGEPNAYYDPTICTVANPALKLSKTYVIDKEGVLVRNDSHMMGVIPILCKYGTLDAEIMITFRLMAINNRISALINADDEAGYQSAKEFLKDIEAGKLGVIQSGGFFDGVTTNDFSNRAGDIKDMIELSQYLRSLEWEEFGININGNMKREYVNDAEMSLSEPAVLPFITNMLENWQEGFEKVNAFYGTDITVDFTPLVNYIEEGDVNNEESQSIEETDAVVLGGNPEDGDADQTDNDGRDEPTGDSEESGSDSGVQEEDSPTEEGSEEEGTGEADEGEEGEEDSEENSEEDEESPVETQYDDATEEEIVEATEAMESDTVELEANVSTDDNLEEPGEVEEPKEHVEDSDEQEEEKEEDEEESEEEEGDEDDEEKVSN